MPGKAYSTDLRWRVIYHWQIYGSSIQETANQLFVSPFFVKKIRRLYRQTRNVSPRARPGELRILTCKYSFICLMCKTSRNLSVFQIFSGSSQPSSSFPKIWHIANYIFSNFLPGHEQRILKAMIQSRTRTVSG